MKNLCLNRFKILDKGTKAWVVHRILHFIHSDGNEILVYPEILERCLARFHDPSVYAPDEEGNNLMLKGAFKRGQTLKNYFKCLTKNKRFYFTYS